MISAGRATGYGHLTLQVIDRLRAVGAYTDLNADMDVRTGGGGSWTVSLQGDPN